MQKDMKRTQRLLMRLFLAILAVATVVLAAFETNLLEPGAWAGNDRLEFTVIFVMELLTLGVIPLALWLFRIGAIRRQLRRQPEGALLRWGSARLLMLGVPLVACVLFYYLFFMKAQFGYLAIILLLSMMFVVPTRDKCESEIPQE